MEDHPSSPVWGMYVAWRNRAELAERRLVALLAVARGVVADGGQAGCENGHDACQALARLDAVFPDWRT